MSDLIGNGIVLNQTIRHTIATALWKQRRRDIDAGIPAYLRLMKRPGSDVIVPMRLRSADGRRTLAYAGALPKDLAEAINSLLELHPGGKVDVGGTIYRRATNTLAAEWDCAVEQIFRSA